MITEIEEIAIDKTPDELLKEIDYLIHVNGESPGGTIISLLREKLLKLKL